MCRIEFVMASAAILVLAIVIWPGWSSSHAYNSEGAGIAYLARKSRHPSGIGLLPGRNDDPPPRTRGQTIPRPTVSMKAKLDRT